MEVPTVEHALPVRRILGASRRDGRLDTAGRAIPDPMLRPTKPTPSSGPDRARAVPDQGGIAMGSGAKRFRVQDLGLSGRDALLLLDALGGQAADLDVAADEVTPGTLAATILFAARTATGELRPGLAGTLAEYQALAARIGGMDPRDALRLEGWVAGFRDAEDHRGASAVRRATRAERAGATLH